MEVTVLTTAVLDAFVEQLLVMLTLISIVNKDGDGIKTVVSALSQSLVEEMNTSKELTQFLSLMSLESSPLKLMELKNYAMASISQLTCVIGE